MKRAQIKELANSIAKYGEISEKDLNWIFANFSRQELKLFMLLLSKEVKDVNVTASYAGQLSDDNKKKIIAMFPQKNISFKRDDENISGGLRFEYGDCVLDYSVSGILKRILNDLRENL